MSDLSGILISMGWTTINDAAGAKQLAHDLLDPTRNESVVVVTIANGYDAPHCDIDTIAGDAKGLARVVLVAPTASWAFADEMPGRTQVYGGAGRVYQTDLAWRETPERSPIRWAFAPQEGKRQTDELIEDAFAAAVRGGLLDRPTRDAVVASGTVAGLLPQRAMIEIEGHYVTVAEELTLPGVPIERLLAKGQQVTGSLDPGARRLDIRQMLPDEATRRALIADSYGIGDVVLVRVEKVAAGHGDLSLVPGVTLSLPRSLITDDGGARVDWFLTPGEAVPAMITTTDPWTITLLDVPPDATPTVVSLLPGGPPWLEQITHEPDPVPEPESADQQPARVPPQPTPAAPSRPLPGPGARPGLAPPSSEHEELEKLRQQLYETESSRDAAAQRSRDAETKVSELQASRDHAVARYRAAEQRRQQAEKQLKAERAKQRDAALDSGTWFIDTKERFRFEVTVAWARRIQASDNARLPLREYDVGAAFLDTLDLDGFSRDKAIDVVVDILTGLVETMPGRELHMLRNGEGGNAPAVTRADGAVCWRAYIEQKTPSARRIHFWRLGDTIELSAVRLHHDMRP